MKDLIERYLVAYNSFDVGGMLSLLSQDVRFENYSGDQLTAAASGIHEFKQLAERSKSLFSEREQRITGLEFSGNFAVATIAYRGKLAADIPNGPPAGTMTKKPICGTVGAWSPPRSSPGSLASTCLA